jgi:hypothetical protein
MAIAIAMVAHSVAAIGASMTTAAILFNGANVVGASNPPTVVVGQQVILSAEPPSSMGSVASQKWTVTGKPVGGYSASATNPKSAAVLPVAVTNPTVQFYWYLPTSGSSTYTVTYSYALVSGKKGSVSAAFAVSPGPNPAVEFYARQSAAAGCSTSACDIFDVTSNGAKQLVMGFGNPMVSGDPGMVVGTGTSAGAGSFQWVQLIVNDNVEVTNDHGGKRSCGNTAGLDTTYPYPVETGVDSGILGTPVTFATGDFPAIGLFAGDSAISRFFRAQMFLMWKSSLPNAIPVPLGSVTWGFVESSHVGVDAPNGWIEPTFSNPFGPASFVTAAPTYPVWRALSAPSRASNC